MSLNDLEHIVKVTMTLREFLSVDGFTVHHWQWRSQGCSRGVRNCLEAMRRFLDPIFLQLLWAFHFLLNIVCIYFPDTGCIRTLYFYAIAVHCPSHFSVDAIDRDT